MATLALSLAGQVVGGAVAVSLPVPASMSKSAGHFPAALRLQRPRPDPLRSVGDMAHF